MRTVFGELVQEAVTDAVMGGISGALFGAAGSGINVAVSAANDVRTGRDIAKNGNSAAVTEMVKAMDTETQKRLGIQKYDETNARMVGKAARVGVENRMAESIRSRLQTLGAEVNEDLVAAIMDSAEPGVELNRQEKKALADSELGRQVAAELNGLGDVSGLTAAQVAVKGLQNGTLTAENSWVIQALAEQEADVGKISEPDATAAAFAERAKEVPETTAPEQRTGDYSKRASEIYADEEQRKQFERTYGPLTGSNTENRATIARTLRAVDIGQYSAEEGGNTVRAATVHTKKQLSIMDEFNNATDTDLVSFYERSNAGENLPPYELKPVSDRAAGEIKRITGIDTAGNRTLFESRMAKHIMNRHGENGTADNSMSDTMNIGRLQWVLDNYDYAEDGGTSTAYVTNKPNGKHGNAKTVNFIKRIDGEIIVVEAVPDTKKKTCFIVSAYMKKAASNSVNAGNPTHAPTSQNASQTAASDANITSDEKAVKSVTAEAEREAPQYTAEQQRYLDTEGQITELAERGRLEITAGNDKMRLYVQESRRGGYMAAAAQEGAAPVIFEGETREDAARQAVEYAKGERNGGQGTRAGGERPVGLGAEGSAEGLAGEAGPDQSGTEQSRRIEKINALGLQQDSAAAQGVKNGTDTVKNRFFRPGDSEAVDKLIREDAEYAAVAALCKARGQNLILFTGLLEVNEGGKVILADGMQQGSDIYIRADGNEHSPLKIYEHEDTHDAIEAAGGESGALYQSMKEKLIRNLGGEEQFEALKAKYAEALPDGYSEYDIVQEMLSDARGTMNDFKGNTKLKAELDEEVRQQVGERRTGRRGSGSNLSELGTDEDTESRRKQENFADMKQAVREVLQELGIVSQEAQKADGKKATTDREARKPGYENIGDIDSFKAAQNEYIQRANPVHDDVHAWIRSTADVLTFEEGLDFDGISADDDVTPDYTGDMVRKALESGYITVYSTNPIKNGNFVTPSRMEAEAYGTRGKLYSKKVKLSDVAWMDSVQGQYTGDEVNADSEWGAKPETGRLSSNGLDADTESGAGNNKKDPYSAFYGLSDNDFKNLWERDYSWQELDQKKPIVGPVLTQADTVPMNQNGTVDMPKLIETVREKINPNDSGNEKNKLYVHIDDINGDVEITANGLRHGLQAAQSKNGKKAKPYQLLNVRATLALPGVLETAVEVNIKRDRANPAVPFARVLLGSFSIVENGKQQFYAVRFVVDQHADRSAELVEMNVLGQLRSMNAKMTARSYVLPPNSMGNSMPLGAVALKVTDVIKDVKDIFPDTFSNDVYVTGLQTVRKPAKGKDFTPGLLFSRVNVDTDTETAISAEEIERNRNTQQTSQEPLQDTGITDNRFTEALKKIGVNNITGSLVDYAGIEVEQQTARTAAEARRYLRRVLRETRADPRTQAFAHDVARGIYTMDDLPNTMSEGIVEELADAYRYADGVVQDSLAYKRRQINAGLDADARKLFADSDNYNPAKFGRLSKTLMNERTPARVLRSIFGEEKGSEIYEAYWRPIIENNAAAKLWKNKQREDVKTFRDSKGTIRELTEDESAYAMKVLEGLAFEEEARNAAGMDKENLDRYIANFNQLMELMPKTGYNTEADRVDDVLSGKLTRSEAAAQSTNKELFEQIMENRLATASLPELSRALQTTLDGYEAALQARQEIRENDTVDAEIIDKAARAYQQKYQDMYTAINQLLVAHGYEEIGFIKGYAPHMQPETAQNGFQRAMEAMGLTGNVSSLPASIAGQTANFKPNMRYNPHFQSRTGNNTEYDIAKGFQEYTDYIGDIIYHMDDIMRLRRAVNYFRTEYAGEGISERISQAQQMLSARTEDKIRFAEDHDLGYIPGMTDGQVADLIDKYIEDNYGETGKLTKYSEFTTWLENAANLLAGKQSLADRGLEYTGGRQMLNVANKLQNLFRQSKVAGSLSSAINQVAQLPAITTHLGAKYSVQALSDIGSGEITDEWRERSAFLVGKMDEVKLRETGYEKFMDWLFKPSGLVDDTVATMAVRGEYLRQMDMGKSEYEAMRLADDYGRQVMGSRAKLEKPQAYESKRIISQMIHMFQVEAVNSFDYIVSDLPVEIRNMAQNQGKTKAATATAAAIVAYLMQAFLLNRLGEEVYGGTPVAFDLLGTTAQFFASGEGLTANEYLLEVIDNGLEDMGQERIFGTENNIGAQDFDTKAALADVAYTAGNDIPLLRNAMAAVGWGDQTLPMINVRNIGKGAKQIYEGAKEGDLRYAAEGAGNIAGEVLPGGSQVKKTIQGLSTVKSGGTFSGAGEERQLKYAVDSTARNWMKAGLFGRSALSQNEQYYAGKAKTLTAGQTDVWEMLVDMEGMDPEEAYKAVQKYREIGKDKGLSSTERNVRERAVIDGLPISDGAKAEAWVDLTHGGNHLIDRYQNIMGLMRMGASWEDVNAAFNTYDRIDDSSQTGTAKATEFAAWADQYGERHKLSDEAVEQMKETFGFSSGHRAEATTYEKLVDSSIPTAKAVAVNDAWNRLQPERGKKTVSEMQKIYALTTMKLTDTEKYEAAGSLTDMEEYTEAGSLSQYGIMLQAQRDGISFEDYAELRNAGAASYYSKYRDTVTDADAARAIALELAKTNESADTVTNVDRAEAILRATRSEDTQVEAFEQIMDETEYFKFVQANGYGVTPEIWAKAKRILPKYDTDFSGTYKQAEVTEAVKAMKGLDNEQRAALWQMLTGGKSNPFDRDVGAEMYKSYNAYSAERKAAEVAKRKAEMGA